MYKKLFCLGLSIMAATVLAASAQEKGEKKSSTTIAAGATVTDGNSDQLIGNASVNHACEQGPNSLLLGAEANYSEINSSVTNEAWKINANYKRILDDRLYAVGNLQYLHDRVADIEWRYTVSPGIGYYLMKKDAVTLSADLGPAYVWELKGGEKDDYAALRVGERYDRTLSDTSKCWQSLEYLPRVEDFSDYTLNFEIGVEAVVSGPISVRLVVQDAYVSEPAPDKEENDLKVIGALSYTL